ncbi:MAG: DUF456 domain-containing protein [Chloroflexota bacterium]
MDPLVQFGAMTVVIFMFLLGIIGIIVPILPGIILIWGGVLFYAVTVDHFTVISPWLFALITLIAIVAGTAEWWLSFFGAKKSGASWKTVLLGVVGAIAGTFFLPIPVLGTVAGYALGILLGEYLRLRDWQLALKAGIGGIVGWGVGTALQMVGALIMIALFLVAVT